MKILDRHILREWLKILGLVLAATLGLLLMQQMYEDFGDLLEAGANTSDVIMYYAVLMPSFLIVVLPLAVLVSLLYSLGQLHRHNEFTVMRAAGLSLFHLTRGIWVIGLLLQRADVAVQRARGALVGRGVAAHQGERGVPA